MDDIRSKFMTPQADWVKTIERIHGELIGHGYNDHANGLEEPTPACKGFALEKKEEMIELISKVESLAQQRTEKKWRAKAKAGYMTYSETGGVPYNMVSANNQALTKLLEE